MNCKRESAQIYRTARDTTSVAMCLTNGNQSAASYFGRKTDMSPFNQAGCDDDAKIRHTLSH